MNEGNAEMFYPSKTTDMTDVVKHGLTLYVGKGILTGVVEEESMQYY